MSLPQPLKCVVMGSFRFKKEIDLAITELKDRHVSVLGPDEGGLFKSDFKGFWPLASERKMPIGMVEDRFIRQILQSDFVYIINLDGYIGNTVSFETGICIAKEIPIYSSCQVEKMLDPDPVFGERIEKYIKVDEIKNVVEIESRRKLEKEEELLLIPTQDEVRRFSSLRGSERR